MKSTTPAGVDLYLATSKQGILGANESGRGFTPAADLLASS